MINKGEAICKRLSNDLDLAGINYSKSKASLEKRRLLLQNSKQLVEEREAKIVLLKKMNENLESKLKNINGLWKNTKRLSHVLANLQILILLWQPH